MQKKNIYFLFFIFIFLFSDNVEEEEIAIFDPDHEKKIIDERRKRRMAILEKYRGIASTSNSTTTVTKAEENEESASVENSIQMGGGTRSPSIEVILEEERRVSPIHLLKSDEPQTAEEPGISAADYDPAADMLEDEYREKQRRVADEENVLGADFDEKNEGGKDQRVIFKDQKKSKPEFDMFADLDMFDMDADQDIETSKGHHVCGKSNIFVFVFLFFFSVH